MKAVVIREFGGPEVLKIEDVAAPKPGPGDVLIKVAAVSVNITLDIILRKGLYGRGGALPHVLGVDPTGEVAAVGPGVGHLKLGDRVTVHTSIPCGDCKSCRAGSQADCLNESMVGVHRWGGYAEHVVVPAKNVFAFPDNLSFYEAAVIMRHFPTAKHQLDAKGGLEAGEWVLVMGAAGGLGGACVQVAKLLGATVIAAAGSEERLAVAKGYGADHVVNYRSHDLAAAVGELTGGRGVDLVAENIGDPTLWPGALNSLARNGRLVTAGAHGGGQVPLDVRRLYIWRLKLIGSPGCNYADIEWALARAGEGRLQPARIDRVLPLAQAAEAHRIVEARQDQGKILLDPTLAV